MYTALLPTQPPKSSAVQNSTKRSTPGTPPESISQSVWMGQEYIRTSANNFRKVETNPPDHLLTEFAPSASTQFALDEIIEVEPPQLGEVEPSHQLHAHLPQTRTSVSIPPPAIIHNTPSGPITSRKPQKGLRKTLSDPSALTTVAGIQSRRYPGRSSLSTVVDEEKVNDQGPWTSEALDLFDFWPPERPKPS